jgi:hypothetical protein
MKVSALPLIAVMFLASGIFANAGELIKDVPRMWNVNLRMGFYKLTVSGTMMRSETRLIDRKNPLPLYVVTNG